MSIAIKVHRQGKNKSTKNFKGIETAMWVV